MKLVTKILIGAVIFTAIAIIGFMLIPILTDRSWWWFGGPFIFILLAWFIAGIVFLIRKALKKIPEEAKININDAKQRTIYETKYDIENPDNLQILKHKLIRVGKENTEPTPVLILEGKGTELNQKRVVIINMNNAKKESTHLIDPTKSEIEESAKLIADNPPSTETTTTTTTLTPYGPQTNVVVKKPSSRERKEQKEKEEAENATAF